MKELKRYCIIPALFISMLAGSGCLRCRAQVVLKTEEVIETTQGQQDGTQQEETTQETTGEDQSTVEAVPPSEEIKEVYKNAQENASSYMSDVLKDMKKGADAAKGKAYGASYYFAVGVINFAKKTVIPVVISAIVLGVILLFISGLNKTLKRMGWFLLIGIPIIWLFLIFGVSCIVSAIYY